VPTAPSDTRPTLDVRAIDHDRVLSAADGYLKQAPVTITSFHSPRSAGGSHDYFSEADYFWPDPAHPGGKYINRDGMSNPDNFNDHRLALIHMSIAMPALVAAYVITNDRKYADHAVEHLTAWFIDDSTRMNPSLPYAQAVSGVTTGRSYGIIDTLHLVEVCKATRILQDHSLIDPSKTAAVHAWFTEYLKWLTTHPNGIKEGNALNNHATCYWLQIAAFAALVQDDHYLADCRERFKTQLLPQMAANGSFPRELERTKPYGYSLFDLDQMTMLCYSISTPVENLWDFTLPQGQTMPKGADFMYPYVKDKSTWPYKHDVMYYDKWPVRSMTWLLAGLVCDEPKYLDLWKSLDANPTEPEVLRNLPIRQPVLWV